MARRRLTHRQRDRIRHIQASRRERGKQRAQQELASMSADGLGPEQTGRIIAHQGATLIVEDDHRVPHRCTARQNLGALACGDRVIWQAGERGDGVVVALEPRRSLLTRPDYSGHPKPVAANIDWVGVVVAPYPTLSPSLIDRYLVTLENLDLPALLVLNKVDLLDPDRRRTLDRELAIYRRIGYPLLHASTRTRHGLDELRAHLSGHVGLLVGQSGVGKSSLIKALIPDRDIRIQALSQATGLGTHTTTTATLYHLPDGGDLIDSPGVRSFEPGELNPAQLAWGFREFRPYLGRCRFSDCRHSVDPGCALREAVEQGHIAPQRLESYQEIRGGPTREGPTREGPTQKGPSS